ncbi:MAG TPA: hypothetical protein VEY70_20360 [Metabacillus sp.]|nr:hypothetical protein [Metabacillus sp.]
MTKADYEVGGTTALLDAIGFCIQKAANVQKYTKEDERADKVLHKLIWLIEARILELQSTIPILITKQQSLRNQLFYTTNLIVNLFT